MCFLMLVLLANPFECGKFNFSGLSIYAENEPPMDGQEPQFSWQVTTSKILKPI